MPNQTLRPEEQEAKQLLERLGLIVHPIPTSPSKRSDFVVDGDARGYIVEVKTRFDSEKWVQTIAKGDAAPQERLMSYDRWTEDVARKALKQIRMIDLQHSRWWILWFVIRCRASTHAMFEAAIGSLFGIRQAIYDDPNSEKKPMRNCLFARPGVFERYKEIVACIVDLNDSFSFCVNEFAADYPSFQQSVFYASLAHLHPPISATDLTINGGFFRIADRSVNKKDEKAIASYLEQTYGLKKAVVLDMEVHSATTFIPT